MFAVIGFAAAFVALTVTRKDGVGGAFRRLRDAQPNFKPLHCSFCAVFWFSILTSLWIDFSLPGVLCGLASSGVACAVLALAGALDLDS